MENSLIFRFKTHHYLQLDKTKSFVYNKKKCKLVTERWNGGSLGIWVGNKFIPSSKWSENIEYINEEYDFKQIMNGIYLK